MKIESFLIISRNGGLSIRKTRPYLNSDEVCIKLNINLPQNFFDRMIPSVDINVPKESIWEPEAELSINLVADEVASKLNLDFEDVVDGLKEALEAKLIKSKQAEGGK